VRSRLISLKGGGGLGGGTDYAASGWQADTISESMKQQILWNTLERDDGTFTVSLSSPPDEDPGGWDGWSGAFEDVLVQWTNDPLNNVRLFQITLLRGSIRIANIASVEAIELGDALEGVVRDANQRAEQVEEAERRRVEREQGAQGPMAAQEDDLAQKLRSRPPGPPLAG
jgi:hypothetical protein